MSADEATLAKLYEDTAQLAYDVNQMAINPLLPFSISDRSSLEAQAQRVLAAAKHLRSCDPAAVDQQKVDTAEQDAQSALTIFKMINTQPTNSYTKEEVFTAVDNAVAKVNAVC